MNSRHERFVGQEKKFEHFFYSHLCYPSSNHKGDRKSQLLGNWVAKQRRLFRNKKVPSGHILSLQRIDPHFFLLCRLRKTRDTRFVEYFLVYEQSVREDPN